MDADRGEGKDLMDDRFAPVWKSDSISPAKRTLVKEMSNIMLEERFRAFPQFENYILAVLSYIDAGHPEEDFEKWNELLKNMLEGRARRKQKFNNLLEQSRYLFAENVLYRSRSTEWKAENGDYEFRIEDGNPVVRFEELDLKCYAKGDSSMIHNTQGTYYPTEEEWIGEGGKVTWERAGFDTSTTYALLGDYEIQVRSSRYDADSVRFFSDYFDRPLWGTLRDQILSARTGDKALYPRFESYDQRLFIEDLVKHVDYEGGMTMQGARLSGSGAREQPAYLHFHRMKETKDGEKVREKVLELAGQSFSIEPKMISADGVRSIIEIEDDSIYHPELRAKFDREERQLTLIREDEGLSKTPYYNGHHELEMYFEALYWKIDDPLMRMGNLKGSTQQQAAFESTDFFSDRRFDALQGLSRRRSEHSLYKIKGMMDKVDTNRFDARSLSQHMRLPFKQVNKLLLDYSTKGFVEYDPDEEEVIVRQKVEDYIQAKEEQKDHDVILFNSDPSQGGSRMGDEQNAQLSLLDHQLVIRGVERVILSQTQNVSIHPRDRKVTVWEDRDFEFKGLVRAGKMNLQGPKFEFDYEEFKLKFDHVDSAHLRVRKLGAEKDAPLRTVRSTIEELKGEIQISHPMNKSGYKDDEYTQYPIITNEKRSYVYYDDEEIQEGAYEKEKFHFHMQPFQMDSLDDFHNKAIAFDGKFHSGGILPPFEEDLTLQKDHSLGFIRDAPEGGFPVYGAGANFDNEIHLSNDGLQGNGNLSFMTANAYSEEFTFFPDSTTGIAKKFENEGQKTGPSVPEVKGEGVKIKYKPEEHIMQASKVREPMTLYQDAQFHGALKLSKSGMGGQGKMSFDNAEIFSDDYDLKHMTADADTADLDLQTPGAESLAFSTHNVNAHLDFEERKGEFKSNGEDSYIEFPENQYVCYMDQFNWFMDQGNLELEASEDLQNVTIDSELDLSGSNFYSTRPDQDSLSFMAPKAEYNIREKRIIAKEIPYIPVADARIAPDSGKIRIEKDAEIQPLENAEILANSITKYHTIQKARAEIKGKNEYEASGEKLYEDLNGMTTPLHFRDIGVDSTGETYGKGVIPMSKDFKLSPHFEYYGKVELTASEEQLTFDGKVRPVHDCQEIERHWAEFRSVIDPENISIPIADSAMAKGDERLTSGVLMDAEGRELSPAFLSKIRDTAKAELINATGRLQFDANAQEYRIASKEKLKQEKLPGNLVRLNNKSCQVSGQGELDHGGKFGQVELRPIGKIERNVEKDRYEIKSATLLDFFLNEKALEEMGDHIQKFPKLDPFDVSQGNYEYAMRELIGTERTDELVSSLTLKGEIEEFPEELEDKIFLSQLNMVWDERSSSFISQGPIGIGSIFDQQLFRYVDGTVQIKKMRSGDELKMYFELNEKNWYYFEYKRGVMQAVSSNEDFNDIIRDTKSSKRKYDGDGPDYRYTLGTERKKIRFLNDLDR